MAGVKHSKSLEPAVKDQYAHVYMPLADIYALGGPAVLNELSRKKEGEKNLVVLPMELATRMDSPEKHLGLLGLGGVKTLEDITASSDPDLISEDKAGIYHFSEGLDVCVYLEQTDSNDPFNNSLMSTIQKRWGKKPEVFTTNKVDLLRAQLNGLQVDKANRFLLVDSGIVDKGMIVGHSKLYDHLITNLQAGVSLEIAEEIQQERLYPNQYIRFQGNEGHVYAMVTGELVTNKASGRIERNMANPKVKLLGRAGQLDHLMRVGRELPRTDILGFKPRDAEQYLATQFGVFNPNIQVSFVAGGAGSGKTLLYLPAVDMILKHPDQKHRDQMGLAKGEDRMFDYLVLLKPIDILGGDSREIGFLPGDMLEKMYQHLLPFEDAHRLSRKLDSVISFKEMFSPLSKLNGKDKEGPKKSEVDGRFLPEYGEPIRIATTGYLRGRSFTRCLIFADEFQNLTPYEAKTLIERLGEGSKLIATGDPSQFDNPKCSRDINGFTYAINYFMKMPYVNLIKLTHSYRREAAEDASKMNVYSR